MSEMWKTLFPGSGVLPVETVIAADCRNPAYRPMPPGEARQDGGSRLSDAWLRSALRLLSHSRGFWFVRTRLASLHREWAVYRPIPVVALSCPS
jgi:hypothetical protein